MNDKRSIRKKNLILITTHEFSFHFHSHENSQIINPFEKTMNFSTLFSRGFSENIFQYLFNENSPRFNDIDVSFK